MADTFNAQPHAQTPPHTALSALTLASPEKLYRILYEDSPCMYFMLDHEGTVLAVNRFGAEHLGYAQEELLGRSVLTVFHDEDKPAAQRQLTLVLATPGQAHRWQLRKIRKDGRLLWVEEDARAIRRDHRRVRLCAARAGAGERLGPPCSHRPAGAAPTRCPAHSRSETMHAQGRVNPWHGQSAPYRGLCGLARARRPYAGGHVGGKHRARQGELCL